MLARQLAIGFGIAIIFPLLVYYGVRTFILPRSGRKQKYLSRRRRRKSARRGSSGSGSVARSTTRNRATSRAS